MLSKLLSGETVEAFTVFIRDFPVQILLAVNCIEPCSHILISGNIAGSRAYNEVIISLLH